MQRLTLVILPILLGCVACASDVSYIRGTEIPRTSKNQQIIERIEEYRLAVERQDAGKLLLMAHEQYWEDGGTPSGADDYGYDKLREVLADRFQQASSIRYSMKYVNIRHAGDRAYVDVLVDASYTVADSRGNEVREDMRDQNQLVLKYDEQKEQWMFLSGY